jgi:hypothetical protein
VREEVLYLSSAPTRLSATGDDSAGLEGLLVSKIHHPCRLTCLVFALTFEQSRYFYVPFHNHISCGTPTDSGLMHIQPPV